MNKCSNLFRFKVGDEYLVWRVISRELDQILMAWEYKGLKVCLYFFHFIFEILFQSIIFTYSLHRKSSISLYIHALSNVSHQCAFLFWFTFLSYLLLFFSMNKNYIPISVMNFIFKMLEHLYTTLFPHSLPQRTFHLIPSFGTVSPLTIIY